MVLSYKLTEDKSAIQMNDKGMPIYIDSENEGKEQGIDAFHLMKKVPSLQADLSAKRAEASSLKEISETLSSFDFDVSDTNKLKEQISSLKNIASTIEKAEISDVSEYIQKATEAFDTLQTFNEKDFKSVEEIEKIKKKATDKIAKDLTEKYTSKEKEYKALLEEQQELIKKQDQSLYKLMVADKFNTSNFVKDKLSRSSREARILFGNNFKVEETESGEKRVFGYLDGERITSLEKPGNYADFEEALAIMIEKDPDRDSLLKGAGKSGTGGGGSSAPLSGIESLMAEQAKALKEGDFVTSIRLKREIANLQKG